MPTALTRLRGQVERWWARWRPSCWPRRARRTAGTIALIALLLGFVVTGYRAVRPADNFSPALAPLPSPVEALPLSYAELASAPLIVEGRLRVYAAADHVWADAPVTANRQMTPYWTVRRWPAEVVGVVAVERQFLWGGGALVIAKWSDGLVTALDTTGRITWQVRVTPDPAETYTGRRTGARTTYRPEGLFLATSAADGRPILVVAGLDQVHAYDPYTGTERWSKVFTGPSGCYRTDWTGQTTYVVKDSCVQPASLAVYDAASGTPLSQWRPPGASAGPGREANWYVQPVACDLGMSRCQLFQAAAVADVITAADAAQGEQGVVPETWSLGLDGTVVAESGVVSDAPLIVADLRIEQMFNGYVWARSRSTGELAWVSRYPGALVAVDGTSVYLVGRKLGLLVLNARTGALMTNIDMRGGWSPGFVYVHDGFMATERIIGPETNDDDHHYLGLTPVLLAGV